MSRVPGAPREENGARAEFTDEAAARRAIRELEQQGIPRNRILVGGQAPDQSGAPMDTEERDKQTVSRLWRLGVRGALLGFLGGGILGGLIGAAMWSPMSPAWILLAVGMAVFGIGLGLLWSLMLGKGEGQHMGTVYDQPDASQPTTITVRTDDPGRVDTLLESLQAAGGENPRTVPQRADRPER